MSHMGDVEQQHKATGLLVYSQYDPYLIPVQGQGQGWAYVGNTNRRQNALDHTVMNNEYVANLF